MDVSDGARIKPTTDDRRFWPQDQPRCVTSGTKLQGAAKVAHINHADNFSALFDLTCCLWVL